jgi:cysteine desulfurase
MTRPRVYLDYNATAPLRPQAREAMLAAMDALGNPSSIHAEGRAARGLLERARETVAAAVGTAARNLVFTSGATEAANLALTPHLRTGRDAPPFDLLLMSAGEHPCVLSGHRFPADAALTLPLSPDGAVSLDALQAALRAHAGRRVMLALQAANNETGVIQPVAEAAALVHAAGGVLVCDATQAVGRRDATFATLAADVLFLSSHKLGGPAGAGTLAFAREGVHIDLALLRGGGQEGGRRAGTENVVAAVGFASAASAAMADAGESSRLAGLRNEAERRIMAIEPRARFVGKSAPRLANTSAFVAPGIAAHTLAMALDLEGVAVSSGSACSSGKPRASHVAEAMGWRSSAEDVELFGIALARVVDRIRSRQSAA